MLTRSLLEVLSQLKGANFQTETYLKTHSKRIEKEFGDLGVSHLSTNLILNDITAKSFKESEKIFLGYSYGANNSHATLQIEANLQFFFALTLSHSYELFEIYIKRLLRIIEKYDSFRIRELIKVSEPLDPTIDNIRTKNNKAYFKILRQLLRNLSIIESSNCWKIDLKHWYHAFSNFRHSVTHGNSLCSNKNYMDSRKATDRFFPVKKHCDDPQCQYWRFHIDYDHLRDNLTLIGDYTLVIVNELKDLYELQMDLYKK